MVIPAFTLFIQIAHHHSLVIIHEILLFKNKNKKVVGKIRSQVRSGYIVVLARQRFTFLSKVRTSLSTSCPLFVIINTNQLPYLVSVIINPCRRQLD